MQSIQAKSQHVLVEIILIGQLWAADTKKLAPSLKGLELPPPKYQGAPYMGKVVSIADDVPNPEYEVGDVVIFKEERPHAFTWNDQDLLGLHYTQVLAKYAGEPLA